MPLDKKTKGLNRIPIKFVDSERDGDDADGADEELGFDEPEATTLESEGSSMGDGGDDLLVASEEEDEALEGLPLSHEEGESDVGTLGGPEFAELVGTRAELKRVAAENDELKDRVARRQAEFENYRKRMERERSETYNRVVADLASKLLPVVDNLKRALDAEASVEASESDEFRHFLSGVDLISRQLNGVLEALGVKPVAAVGEHFNPHVHEAVVTEPTDDYEPDTVLQEIVTGYRLGDKLLRPALVKVAVRK